MSKDLLKVVIDRGVRDNLNTFFLDVSNDYSEIEDNLSIYDDDRFANFQMTGEIVFSPNEKLVVVTAEVAEDLTERSGKKAQYEKARKILKDYMKYDAGVFVFSDPTGSFRFSLVYGQAEGIRKSWSNFRRFTYFVSRDQTNKTFLDRVGGCDFSSLDVIKDAFSVEKVTKDFYKQIAHWYFWAAQNVTFPKDAEAEDNGRNIAVIRMITRLIFIWFMRERKLVSPDLFSQEKIAALLKSLKPDETTYYKAILQNLFFATLNTQKRSFRFTDSYHGKNRDYMNHNIYRYEDYFKNPEDTLAIFKDIPFLNGGLFDCLDWSAKEGEMDREVRFDGFSDKEVGLRVPNYLFFSGEKEANLNKEYGTKNKKYHVQGLLNLLSAYNFTIDENEPNDQEVALDPELLGKVFENLLASFNPETATTARKATGSYYTPREIVDYMVTQSLKQYYKTHLNDVIDIDNKLEELLSPIIEDEPVNPFGADDSKKVVRLTEGLRIVDPAVGSGAFPMGILNKLVSVLARVDRDNKLWREAQLKAVEGVTDQLLKQKLVRQINEQFSERDSNYGRKLYLIQKCIYGVDIQQIAIEIAKLRFFIALLVDERIDRSKPNWGIEPLPNLDFKLMQGNSLISEFMGINLDAGESDSYGKLMKDETEELISEYRNRKTDYQYEPDRTKRGALKNDIDKLIVRIFESKLHSQKAEYLTKLRNIERKYAGVPDIQQRDEAIKKDTAALNQNYGFDLAQTEKQLKEFTSGLKVKPFFAWRLYFAEVFHEKGGFDIVIANPPYLGEKGHKEMFREIKKGNLGRFYQGKMDLFYFFLHLALNLGKQNSNVAFITTDYYPTATGAKKLRQDFRERAIIKNLMNFNELKIFESALGQHNMITILSKGHDDSTNAGTCVTEQQGIAAPQALQSILGWQDKQTIYYEVPQKDLYEGEECYIRLTGTGKTVSNKLQALLNKVKNLGQSLNTICTINQGVVSGCDYVSSRNIKKLENTSNIQDGDGIFVFDLENERDRKTISSFSDKERRLLRPFFKNTDTKRYWCKSKANKLLLYLDRECSNIDKYPNIRIHLQKFYPILVDRREVQTKRIKYFQLQWPRVENIFIGPKITVPYRSEKNSFAYNDYDWFCRSDSYVITSKDPDVELKYILSLLNSKLYYLWLYHKGKRKGRTLELFQVPLSEIPIMTIDKHGQKPFITMVDKILSITKDDEYPFSPDKQAQVKEYERQIDQMVYQLYDLTWEEIAIVKGFDKK